MNAQEVLQAMRNAGAAGDMAAAKRLAALAVRLQPDLAPPEEVAPPAPKSSFMGDILTAGKLGVVGSTKALTDVAGADNVLSRSLGAKAEEIQKQYSPERQAEMQMQAERMKTAEESGSIWEEVKAGAKSIAEAPLESMAQGVGSFAPYIPTMILGPVAGVLGLGAKTVAALTSVANAAPKVLGTAQGMGAVKGQIYDTVLQKEIDSGVSPEEAKAKALAAQEYTGKNLDQLALGGLLGFVAGSSGIEKLLTPKGVTTAAQGMTKRIGKTALTEAATEAPQGGQERMAANIALQREGYDVPTFQGVAGQATQEGLTGALAAGPIGAIRGPSAAPAPAGDQDAEAKARQDAFAAQQLAKQQGISGAAGEKILNAEAAAQAAADKEQAKLAAQTMKADEDQRYAAREAELTQAFPDTYEDFMSRPFRTGEIEKEIAYLGEQRKTAGVQRQLNALRGQLAKAVEEDNRAPTEMLRMRGEQIAAARKAGFPAAVSARVFESSAPAQMEMREAMQQGELPAQLDLQGNPIVAPMQQTTGLNDIISAELPATTDVLGAADIAPTRKELEAAGQQRLDLRATPGTQPTSPIRDESGRVVKPKVAKPLLPEATATPADLTQPDAVTAKDIADESAAGKLNPDEIKWLNERIVGRTPNQIETESKASPGFLKNRTGKQREVLKNIMAAAKLTKAPDDQLPTAVPPKAQQANAAVRSESGVGVPSQLPAADAVGGKPTAATSTAEPAQVDGRGLDVTGEPAQPSNVPEGNVQPALDAETARKAEEAEYKAVQARVEAEAKAKRETAPPPYVAPKASLKSAAPATKAEAPAATGSPFAILNKIQERQAAQKKAAAPAKAKVTPAKAEAPVATKLVSRIEKGAFGGAKGALGEKLASRGRKSTSEAVVPGQSLGSLRGEVLRAKGILGAALRRAVASGKIVLEAKDPKGNNGGYFDGSKVTLYADGIPAGQAMAVALHEIGAHLGFKKMLGERVYNLIIKQIQQTAATSTNSADRALAQRALNRIPESDKARGAEVYGDETIAYFIEEATKAQDAGTLAKSGPVRAMFNNIRLAMLAAVNRVFGSKIGVAGFTTQDILSMAEGAFIKESFTAVQPADTTTTPADKGRASATQRTTSILADMDRKVPAQDSTPYLTQVKSIAAKFTPETKNGVNPARRLLNAAADTLDAGEALMRSLRVAMREALPETAANNALVEVAFSQASNHEGVSTVAFDLGGIAYDAGASKFKAEKSEFNKGAIDTVYGKMVKDYKAPLSEVRYIASTALESKRMLALYDAQAEAIANAEVLKKSGNAKAAKKMREKAEGYIFHMSKEQATKGMELFNAMPEIYEIERLKEGTRNWIAKHLRDTGVWSDETSQWLLDNLEWIPFNREAADKENETGGYTSYIRGLQAKVREPGFKGSMREVHDVMDNFENWTTYSISKGILNQKATDLADAALTYLPTDEAQSVAKPRTGAAERTVMHLVDGVPKYVQFDTAAKAQIFRHAPAMAKSAMPVIGGFIDSLNGIFRGSILNFPLFPVYQLAMDSISAAPLSGLPAKYAFKLPFVAVKEALKMLVKPTTTHEHLRAFGAVGVHDFNATLADSSRLATKGMENLSAWGKYKSVMHNANMGADNAVRQAVYLMARESGLSEAAAVEKAFEIINFRTRVGSNTLASAARNVVFLNSFYAASRVALKVLSSEGTSPTERAKARKTLISTMSWIGATSFFMALANIGDDDYEKMSRAEQASKLTLPGLGGWGIPLRPDPFLLVKYMAEMVARQGFTQYTDDSARIKTTIGEAISNTLFSGPMPVAQPLKVAAELFTNYSSFTSRPIVGRGQESLESYMQQSAGTSAISKAIGQSSKNLTDALGFKTGSISPVQMDHFIKGMLGMYGGAVILATNQMVNDRPTESVKDIIASMPGMGRIAVKTFDSQLKTDFYDLANEVNTAVDTLNAFKAAGLGDKYREYAEKNTDRLKYRGTVAAIQRQLSGIRKSINVISKSNRPQEDKDAEVKRLRETEQRMLNNLAPLIKKMRTESL